MGFFKSIIRYFKSLFSVKDKRPDKKTTSEKGVFKPVTRLQKQPHTAEYIVKQMDDLPDEDQIENNTIYIIGEKAYNWLAALKCP